MYPYFQFDLPHPEAFNTTDPFFSLEGLDWDVDGEFVRAYYVRWRNGRVTKVSRGGMNYAACEMAEKLSNHLMEKL